MLSLFCIFTDSIICAVIYSSDESSSVPETADRSVPSGTVTVGIISSSSSIVKSSRSSNENSSSSFTSLSSLILRYLFIPVPAGISLPMITFSFIPINGSILPLIAASVYFVNNNGFKAVRCGIAKSGDAYNGFTRPNVHEDDPLYWMKASEVCFLKAEGALAGFDMGGSAGDFYNAGIRMSFNENGLSSSSAENYLKDHTRKPANYTDTANGELSANAPSSITIRWENGATEEEKLERIITQKYLAIFPNGQEAWTEWRRTGYPRQIVVAENKTNSAVLIGNGHDLGGVRRLPYPRTEYEQNGENLHNAISQYLGGVDNAATKVWWDKKSK